MCTTCSQKNIYIFEEKVTPELLEEDFLKCIVCSPKIYNDIKNYFHRIPVIKKQYEKIVSGEYTKEHLTLMDVKNNKNPISIMMQFILTTYKNFEKNAQRYYNICNRIQELEDLISRLLHEQNYENDGEYITEIENNLEDLYYEADVCEPFYNPYEQKWYHDDCPRALYVYAYHTVGNGAPKKQYFKGIKNCCNVDVYKIVLSTMVTFLFELLTHKSVVPIFRKFINYSSVMEKNIVNKLLEIKNKKILCSRWKGADYYYKKIFYKSIYLNDIPIGKNELLIKYIYGFDNMICGHPKASHGWFYEAWNEYKDIYQSLSEC